MTPPTPRLPVGSPLLVALGDSMVCGREDPDPAGGWYGWVARLARHLGIPRDRVANTAVEGALAVDVVNDQVRLVRDVRPRLVAFSCGMNDVTGGTDPEVVSRAMETLLTWATGTDALVLTTGLLPCWSKMRISRIRRARLEGAVARFNEELAARAAARHGVLCLDPTTLPGVSDPGMWAADGIHLSPSGHEAVAQGFARLARRRLPLETSGRLSLGLGMEA
ncbi:GDSL-type esterase/lipase family protein [Streptomyces mayteni]